MGDKRPHAEIKSNIHPSSLHRERYDFEKLVEAEPGLAVFVRKNEYNDLSIDFADPKAVKMLNKALLGYFYGIVEWEIPPGYLCPPIPGRADYLHHAADLLATGNAGKIPAGSGVKCLDIGTGANCVYPLIGTKTYGWQFVGSETDSAAIQCAEKIIRSNPGLAGKIQIRKQNNPDHFFKGIVHDGEKFHLTVCNPPFHSSAEEAQYLNLRKTRNLKKGKAKQPNFNFGGQNHELWCPGGEKQFVKNMILESREYGKSCLWFTSLVAKEANLKPIYYTLRKVKAAEVKTIEMKQGNKISRFVAWTFEEENLHRNWWHNK